MLESHMRGGYRTRVVLKMEGLESAALCTAQTYPGF
jgi:hypothetical protein